MHVRPRKSHSIVCLTAALVWIAADGTSADDSLAANRTTANVGQPTGLVLEPSRFELKGPRSQHQLEVGVGIDHAKEVVRRDLAEINPTIQAL